MASESITTSVAANVAGLSPRTYFGIRKAATHALRLAFSKSCRSRSGRGRASANHIHLACEMDSATTATIDPLKMVASSVARVDGVAPVQDRVAVEGGQDVKGASGDAKAKDDGEDLRFPGAEDGIPTVGRRLASLALRLLGPYRTIVKQAVLIKRAVWRRLGCRHWVDRSGGLNWRKMADMRLLHLDAGLGGGSFIFGRLALLLVTEHVGTAKMKVFDDAAKGVT